VGPAAIAVAAGVFWIIYRGRFLGALSVGEEAAHTLGVPVRRLRMEMFVVTALMTGVLVAASGAVGFIGLVIPHCARWLGGGRLRIVGCSRP
jgi:iron complex transport system permease protein